MVDSIQRITSALQSARDLTLGAAAVASSRIGESSYTQYSKSIDPDALIRLLNSRNSREVKDAMKRIMSLLATNDQTMELRGLLADVLKNITSDDLKVKRMVCIYLLRFAESDPNLALLSVNTIQKSLVERDPEAKALALKALSDINVSSLYPITLQSVKKCVSDVSPLVRSTSAFAVYKLFQECVAASSRKGATAHHQDDGVADMRKNELVSLIVDLLADADPLVISSAIVVLHNCIPDRLDLLHGHFRRYCQALKSLSHWAQPLLVESLFQYSRRYIERPKYVNKNDQSEIPVPFNQDEDETLGPEFFKDHELVMDPDLELFLNSLRPLLFSSNAAVVASVAKAVFHLAPLSKFREFGIPQCLIKSFQLSSNENKCVILQVIAYYSVYDPRSFARLYQSFLPANNDDSLVGSYKLKIISILINESNVQNIVHELKHHISSSSDTAIVKQALSTLVVCAYVSNGICSHVIKWLLEFMETDELKDVEVTSELVNVLRHLIQINPSKNLSVMIKLSEIITTTDNLSGYAKAGIIWLFGEYLHTEPRIVPDILRKLIPNFAEESKECRMQILILAAKILSFDIDKSEGTYDFENSRIAQLYDAVIYLAKFDDDFDIRDKARSFDSLFTNQRYEILTLLLQAPKPWPAFSVFSYEDKAKDIAHLDLSQEVVNSFQAEEWNNDREEEVDRTPAPVNDFMKNKSSISSSIFFANRSRNTEPRTMESPSFIKSPSPDVTTFTSSKGKTYKLQSLEEFFADVPERPKTKKKIVIQEESETDSAEESEESEEDDDDDDESENSEDDENEDDEDDDDEDDDDNSNESESSNHILLSPDN
ncbi:AP-3 complex subunit beta [Kluyveromyces marxianus]